MVNTDFSFGFETSMSSGSKSWGMPRCLSATSKAFLRLSRWASSFNLVKLMRSGR